MVLQIGFFFEFFQLKYFTIHPLLIFDQNTPYIFFIVSFFASIILSIKFLKHWMSVDFCLTKVSIFTKYETFLYKRLEKFEQKVEF